MAGLSADGNNTLPPITFNSALNPIGSPGYMNYGGADTVATAPNIGATANSGYTPSDPSTDGIMGYLKSLFSGALNKTDAQSNITQQGWAAPVIGGASALAQGFLGMQQYGLAKDTLQQQKDQFNANYNNQKTLTNAQLTDRQTARVAAGAPGAYQSVGSYMAQNGIK